MMLAARFASVIVPILGLAALWGWSDHLSRQGTDWDVEIQGYDPRDLLRGHYVEFTYEWPLSPQIQDEGEEFQRFDEPLRLICLHGSAPKIDRAERIEESEARECAHPARADRTSVYGFSSLERGRLYVGQERAKEIEAEMRSREQVGIVRIRQRDDGVITPLSIRFRPLADNEVAPGEGGTERELEQAIDTEPAV